MNLCQTCVHWKPLFTGEKWGVRSFADLSAEQQKTTLPNHDVSHRGITTENPSSRDWPMWGDCALTILESEEAETSLARAMDGSAYFAVLRCRANFGCVQHKPTT